MKNKIFYLSSVIIAFFFGAVVSYIAISKQQMDQLNNGQDVQQSTNPWSKPSDNNGQQNVTGEQNTQNQASAQSQGLAQVANLISEKTNVPIENVTSKYSEDQAKNMLGNLPDAVIGQYVDKFMSTDASDHIVDKRRFAERAIEELYTPNGSAKLAGDVKMALDDKMPKTSQDTSKVDKYAQIYAHLDTKGEVPNSANVFVKWVNNETGKVLLFQKKDIIADSQQNWVSFIPDDGWQAGSYDVRFYQFTSELQPIAQSTYQIYEVNE